MDSPTVIWVFGLLVFGLVAGQIVGVSSVPASKSCRIQAIYNFGDSNSDTGGRSAALSVETPPNGETFFGKPSGRGCDGRLIIDFIAENLGLPYLSAYLDSIGTSFRHGANFATGGSCIRPCGYSPFDIDIQISQFIQFKSRTTALNKQLSNNNGKIPTCGSSLPRPDDFSTALYTIDIGQNDLSYGFEHTTIEEVRASLPDILDKFTLAVHQLYKEGAKVFWVHNTGPIGCLPNSLKYDPSKPGNLDQNGCVKPKNEVAEEFNRQLKDRVSQLRVELSDAAFTYVDVYSAKYAMIGNAKNLGFDDPMKACYSPLNRTIICNDPSKYISWDGIHYTQAANMLLAKLIVNGSLSEPPTSIADACHARMNT